MTKVVAKNENDHNIKGIKIKMPSLWHLNSNEWQMV